MTTPHPPSQTLEELRAIDKYNLIPPTAWVDDLGDLEQLHTSLGLSADRMENVAQEAHRNEVFLKEEAWVNEPGEHIYDRMHEEMHHMTRAMKDHHKRHTQTHSFIGDYKQKATESINNLRQKIQDANDEIDQAIDDGADNTENIKELRSQIAQLFEDHNTVMRNFADLGNQNIEGVSPALLENLQNGGAFYVSPEEHMDALSGTTFVGEPPNLGDGIDAGGGGITAPDMSGGGDGEPPAGASTLHTAMGAAPARPIVGGAGLLAGADTMAASGLTPPSNPYKHFEPNLPAFPGTTTTTAPGASTPPAGAGGAITSAPTRDRLIPAPVFQRVSPQQSVRPMEDTYSGELTDIELLELAQSEIRAWYDAVDLARIHPGGYTVTIMRDTDNNPYLFALTDVGLGYLPLATYVHPFVKNPYFFTLDSCTDALTEWKKDSIGTENCSEGACKLVKILTEGGMKPVGIVSTNELLSPPAGIPVVHLPLVGIEPGYTDSSLSRIATLPGTIRQLLAEIEDSISEHLFEDEITGGHTNHILTFVSHSMGEIGKQEAAQFFSYITSAMQRENPRDIGVFVQKVKLDRYVTLEENNYPDDYGMLEVIMEDPDQSLTDKRIAYRSDFTRFLISEAFELALIADNKIDAPYSISISDCLYPLIIAGLDPSEIEAFYSSLTTGA